MQAFSGCSEWGLVFIAVHALLSVVASLVAGHRLSGTGSVVVVYGSSCSVVSGECVLLGSVSSQQRFGVTDIKALLACHSSWVFGRPCYSSQVSNGPCYSS